MEATQLQSRLTRDELVAVIKVLEACGGNRRRAGAELGISEAAVYYRVERAKLAGLAVPACRPGRPKGFTVTREAAPPAKATDRDEPSADPWPKIDPRDEQSRRELWRRYVAGGRRDDALRNYLIELELPKVRALAGRMKKRLADQVEHDDLMQAASIGLIESAASYDPERVASFWTFAALRSGGAMIDQVRGDDHVPRLTRIRERARRQFEGAFERIHGRLPDADEIRAGLGWQDKQLADSYPAGRDSLDRPRSENDRGLVTTAYEILASCEEGPGAATISEDWFRETCGGLPFDREIMLWMYYVRGATMKAIAGAFGCSESWISVAMREAVELLAKRWQRAEELAP